MTKTATVAPVKPPNEWFADPKFDGPTPLTVTPNGRVFGHAALWGTCHTGYPGQCVTPPRATHGYSQFHLGAIETAEGDEIAVGKITVGGGHASVSGNVDRAAARAHYDDVATVAAFVRAGEDAHGIWLAGALRSDLPPAMVAALKANPVSGDWRGGAMIAAHCVPTPGFQVPRLVAASIMPGLPEPVLAMVASFAPPMVFQELSPRVREILNTRPAVALRPKAKKAAVPAKAKTKARSGAVLRAVGPDPVPDWPADGQLRAVGLPAEVAVPADGGLYLTFREPEHREVIVPPVSTVPVVRHHR